MSHQCFFRLRWLEIRSVVLIALVTILGNGLASAADSPSTAPEVLESIVSVQATIPGDAHTADTLGTERGGSGVVIDDEGLILTIGFLVLEADSVMVRTHAGRRVPASVVAYHGDTGFGLLKASGDLQVRPMRLGSSTELDQEDPVLVASYGGVKMLMPAVVASRRLFVGAWEYLLEDAIFTTPPHPLAAGAALIGPEGTLLGIGYLTVGAAASSDSYLPGNMFVPINVLKPILGDLIATGRAARPARPWLGLYTEEVNGRVFIERVAEDGPADEAGVRPGDIVVRVGGDPVADMADLFRKIWSTGEAGVSVPLTVLQEADIKEISVISRDRNEWYQTSRSF